MHVLFEQQAGLFLKIDFEKIKIKQTTTEKADKKTRQNVECYWQFASLFEFLKINLVKTQVDEQQAGLFLKIDFEIPR
jgi:hypothetical protein